QLPVMHTSKNTKSTKELMVASMTLVQTIQQLLPARKISVSTEEYTQTKHRKHKKNDFTND
ncbi:8786_t:CDS:1, partial [Gigaspora margarita]